MFELLTKYLVSHRSVSIPSIGNFRMIHEGAQLDVAEKRILPPTETLFYDANDQVSHGQLEFLAESLRLDRQHVSEKLEGFGSQLRQFLKINVLEWNGVGKLELVHNTIVFIPQTHMVLEPVTAAKVIHENARHTIRVGEKEVSSNFFEEQKKTVIKRYDRESLAVLLLITAILFILYWLFRNHFAYLGTGMQS